MFENDLRSRQAIGRRRVTRFAAICLAPLQLGKFGYEQYYVKSKALIFLVKIQSFSGMSIVVEATPIVFPYLSCVPRHCP